MMKKVWCCAAIRSGGVEAVQASASSGLETMSARLVSAGFSSVKSATGGGGNDGGEMVVVVGVV